MSDVPAPQLKKLIDCVSVQADRCMEIGAPCVIAIAGGSASGKTTLTKQLAANLGFDRVVILQQDAFQLGWDFADQENSPYRWDDPRNYTPEQIRAVLLTLLKGEPVEVPRFDLAANVRVGTVVFEPAPIILFEGLYTLADEFCDLIEESIYVSAPLYARFLRRIFRFMSEVGSDKGAIAVRHMFNFVVAAHRTFVTPQQLSATHIFSEPYDFVEETAKKFGLHEVRLPEPQGVLGDSIKLPSNISLELYTEVATEQSQFAIRWEGQIVFRCEIETATGSRMYQLDWLSA